MIPMADVMPTAAVNQAQRILGFPCSATSTTAQVPAQSTAVLRFFLGLHLCIWAVHYLISGRAELLCNPMQFHFTYPGFHWVRPWPGSGTVIQFWILALSGATLAIGMATRLSAIVAATEFTHFFLIDRTNYQNHYYFMLLMLWWLTLLPTNRCWSIDGEFHEKAQHTSGTISRLVLTILQFHVALPYVFGGLAKLESDWLMGTPMRLMLMQRTGLPESSFVVGFASGILAWGGLLFDLCIVPGLLVRKTRLTATLIMLVFHLTNAALFPIHIFPWLMLAASTIFFPPDWPGQVQKWLQRRQAFASPQPQASLLSPGHSNNVLSLSENHADAQSLSSPIEAANQERAETWRMLPAPLIAAWCLFQILWPLRSHLYEGNANWTERGHFFSWRMMLRAKTASAEFIMRNPGDGSIWKADVRRLLNPEQTLRYSLDPEMIRQLALHLSHLHAERTGITPEVHVLATASLNGRPPRLLIDPAANLADSHNLADDSWILTTESRVASSTDLLQLQRISIPETPAIQL